MAHDLDRLSWEESLATLRRTDSSGLGSGLSRAIALHLGIDVVIVRVTFVALTFCAGLGLALYGWGSVLSPGPNGGRPIDSIITGFRSWSPTARILLVLGTSVAIVAAVGASTSLPWGLALLAALALWWFTRRNQARGADSASLFTAQPMDENELIEQWRRQTSAAVGRRVVQPPAVAQPPIPAPPSPPAAPAPRASWLAALVLTASAAGVWVLCFAAFGLSPSASTAVAAIGLGAACAVFGVACRNRRLPRIVVAMLVIPLVACGWLTAGGGVGAPSGDTHVVRVFADSTTVDLRDLTDVDTVEIVAVASDVTVLAPGLPEGGITTTKRFSSVDIQPDATSPRWPVRLVIDATASSVTVEGPRP